LIGLDTITFSSNKLLHLHHCYTQLVFLFSLMNIHLSALEGKEISYTPNVAFPQ